MTLESRPVGSSAEGAARSAIGWIGLHAIEIGVIGILLVYVVPHFEAMFAEKGIRVPDLTARIVDASHYAKNYWRIGAALGLIFLVADAVVYVRLTRCCGLGAGAAWAVLVALAFGAFVALCVYGFMVLPFPAGMVPFEE